MDRGDGVSINVDRWLEGEQEELLGGLRCEDCSHFFKLAEGDEPYWVQGAPFCFDCWQEQGLIPSEDFFNHSRAYSDDEDVDVHDDDSYYGDDAE